LKSESEAMSLIYYFSVHCYRVLGLILVLCVGASVSSGQKLRVSDADVVLEGMEEVQASGEIKGGDGAAPKSRVSGGVLANRHSGNEDQSRLVRAIYRESARHSLDPNLVFAIVWQESRFKLNAISSKNARGPMQLMPETAARFGVHDPHDPDQAVSGGVAYLVWLLDRFGGNVSLALAAFNSGEMAVEAYLYGRTIVLNNGRVINRGGIRNDGIPPYAETVNYVRSIAQRYRLLSRASVKHVVQ
jgi:soluble lytic murein transglycosylase-like protein